MIIKEDSTVTSTGENKYEIEISGKTFKSLFGDLYAKPFESMIREIVANAQDTNKRAGYDGPVEIYVHREGLYSSYIEIKDHGVGMSLDDMKSVYTTFFKSTKDTSNTDIGGFGIGSKSPLAYADLFTAISVKDGFKNVIVTSKNDNVPTYQILAQDIPTDEGNGTTIKIPIKNQDLDRIIFAYSQELIGFVPLPTLTANSELKFRYPKIVQLADNVRVVAQECSDDRYVSYRRSLVSVGGPVYEINRMKRFLDKTVIIDVPIDKAEVSLSRESLSNEPDILGYTSAIIDEAMPQIIETIKAMPKEELLSCDFIPSLMSANGLFLREITNHVYNSIGLQKLKGLFFGYFDYSLYKRWSKKYASTHGNPKLAFGPHNLKRVLETRILTVYSSELFAAEEFIYPASKLSKDVILVSDKSKEELGSIVNELGFSLVYVGTDSPTFKGTSKSRRALKAEEGDPIKFSSDYLVTNTGSAKLLYKPEEITDKDLFVLVQEGDNRLMYGELFRFILPLFKNRTLYVGRPTPKGLLAASQIKRDNIVIIDSGVVRYASSHLLSCLNEEEKALCISHAAAVLYEPDPEDSKSEVKTFGGNLFTGEFVYAHKLVSSYENSLKDYIDETIQKISKEHRTSESVEKDSFITYMGVLLIRQMVIEELNRSFPLWNNIREVYTQYIERLKNELSSGNR